MRGYRTAARIGNPKRFSVDFAISTGCVIGHEALKDIRELKRVSNDQLVSDGQRRATSLLNSNTRNNITYSVSKRSRRLLNTGALHRDGARADWTDLIRSLCTICWFRAWKGKDSVTIKSITSV
jgi:hypothetical protein